MDIDEDGTQRAAAADDFGVEPDFEELDEEAKEVSDIEGAHGHVLISIRTAPKRSGVSSKRRSPG
jgi:hypothetical protein